MGGCMWVCGHAGSSRALEDGLQYAPPHKGKDMVGWKVEAAFPNIKTGVLEWHGGFVFDFAEKQLESGARTFSYRLFFPIDANDEWVHPPFNDKALCFRKPHLPNTKVDADEMRSARAALEEKEEEEEDE